MTSQTLAGLFQLCLARSSLAQISLDTRAVHLALKDIDEQIELAADFAGIPVAAVWEMFRQTGREMQSTLHAASTIETIDMSCATIH